jgi:DNA-binding SARP family transcriptional activator
MRLLGGFQLTNGGRTVPLPMGAQRLLAFLALQGRPQIRDCVAGRLWSDTTEEHAHASLRTALWRLRATELDLVHATALEVSLAPPVSVDVRTAVALARSLEEPDDHYPVEGLTEAAFTGVLLPDWHDDWVLIERERLRQVCLHALESLSERLVRMGRYAAAAQAALAAVDCEPLRDSSQRCIIRVYLAEGNAIEAINQYRAYSALLRAEIGVAPSAQMRELVRPLGIV